MVAHPRTPTRSGALRALSQPQPIDVREGDAGRPTSIRLGKRWQAVARIEDAWRIDDEWWRERPIARLYLRVVLKDGTTLGLFKDLVREEWYKQQL